MYQSALTFVTYASGAGLFKNFLFSVVTKLQSSAHFNVYEGNNKGEREKR